MDFATLYRRYARDVYRFALFLSGRPEEADDITAACHTRRLREAGLLRQDGRA